MARNQQQFDCRGPLTPCKPFHRRRLVAPRFRVPLFPSDSKIETFRRHLARNLIPNRCWYNSEVMLPISIQSTLFCARRSYRNHDAMYEFVLVSKVSGFGYYLWVMMSGASASISVSSSTALTYRTCSVFCRVALDAHENSMLPCSESNPKNYVDACWVGRLLSTDFFGFVPRPPAAADSELARSTVPSQPDLKSGVICPLHRDLTGISTELVSVVRSVNNIRAKRGSVGWEYTRGNVDEDSFDV